MFRTLRGADREPHPPRAGARSVIAHDYVIKIPGEGMPRRGSYSHKSQTYKYGDLTVQFAISFPEKLERTQQVELRKILTGVRCAPAAAPRRVDGLIVAVVAVAAVVAAALTRRPPAPAPTACRGSAPRPSRSGNAHNPTKMIHPLTRASTCPS